MAEPSKEKFVPQRNNANLHTRKGLVALEEAMRRSGYVAPMTAVADGEVIDGSARIEVAEDVFPDAEPIVVHHDGTRPIIMVRDDIPNASDPRAIRIALEANRIQQLDLMWNPTVLDALAADSPELLEGLFDQFDLEGVRHVADAQEAKAAEPGKAAAPMSRPDLPDLIMCISNHEIQAMARLSGWKMGINTHRLKLDHWSLPYLSRHTIFCDIDWREYDHPRHLEAIAHFKPKYATVRDLLTKADCERLGIPFVPFDDVIRMADELQAAGAQNVIVVPKYDCIKDIPEQFTLGFSVPTKWGQTDLLPEKFMGRNVHLLGGSWMKQLQLLGQLGTGVKSLDGNGICLAARFGHYVLPDGDTAETLHLPLGYLDTHRASFAYCLVSSMRNIAVKLDQICGVAEAPEMDIPLDLTTREEGEDDGQE